ncbi:MAG: DUF3179 domain-containing protein [Chloroflexota bacterium]
MREHPIIAVTLAFVASGCAGSIAPPPEAARTSGAESFALSPSVAPLVVDPSRLRVTTAGWRTDFTRAGVDLAQFRAGGPPKDGIPSIDGPVFESIADSRRWQDDKSPVILLEVGGEAKAYPLAILMFHEIVNDAIAGVPVVVTFCPLCNTALVFDRRLDGTTYDFGTTGNLRFSDLVMYDRQTESWWQQATGEAVVGELTGAKLRFLPAQIVGLAEFERTHPTGLVLSRETGYERDYLQNPYVGYDTIDQNPFLFDGVVDGRLPPKERVVTVGEGDDAIGFPYSELRKTGVAEAVVDGRPIVVLWQPGASSALDEAWIYASEDVGGTGVFVPEIDGQRLTFARDGGEDTPIRDEENGSTWSVTGLAVGGPLAGKRLEPVVHGDHFWFAWAAFVPETTIWTAP